MQVGQAVVSRSLSPAEGVPRQEFSTREVARTLGVTPAKVRALVHVGVCYPAQRGRAWRYRFQDLVLLRTAVGLVKAKVPLSRLRMALLALRKQLPMQRPLSGVRVYADGKNVVVRAGKTVWQPDSGQVLFSFTVDELAQQVRKLTPPKPGLNSARSERKSPGGVSAAACFERALYLEGRGDNQGAEEAYRQAIELDPQMADAHVNLGRLAHNRGDIETASQLYHVAVDLVPQDPVAHYNLALTLEDKGRTPAAMRHYQRAIQLDAHFADAHFNLARLLELAGLRSQALKHLAIYKRLSES